MARATAELFNGDFAVVTQAIIILLGWAATKEPKPVLLQLRKLSKVGKAQVGSAARQSKCQSNCLAHVAKIFNF